MAMEPSKLKAYMDSKQPELDEEYEDEAEGEDEEAGEDESHEEDEMEVVDEEGFNDFFGALMDNADALSSAAGDIAEELTHDSQPSSDTVAQMKEQYDEMPAEVKDGIADFIKGMEYDHVIELAEQLEESDSIDDPEQVGGWLYWVAKNV